jgi:UDP-glucuronate 4-epimerase
MIAAKRILVTGAAGFIGMHVARALLASGHAVTGLDNIVPYYDPALKAARLAQLEDAGGDFRFIHASVADGELIRRLFGEIRPDIVVHLAAQAGVRHSLDAPWDYAKSNLDGFLAMIEAVRHHPVEHLVYASSSSVYGRNTKVPFSESDPVERPSSLYAATKRANELMAEAYAHLFAIPMTGLRFFTVYGPWGRPDMAPWKFAEAILDDRPIDVFDEAHMRRDFTYIDDIVEGILRLLPLPPQGAEGEAPHRIVNIGNNRSERLADFIAAMEAACGKPAQKRHLPRQPGDVSVTFADIDQLAALTGYRPEISITEGTRRFVEWLRIWRGRN